MAKFTHCGKKDNSDCLTFDDGADSLYRKVGTLPRGPTVCTVKLVHYQGGRQSVP